MKVIKEGVIPAAQKECKVCGCIFEYERNDIKTITTPVSETYQKIVECPTCKIPIKVK